MKNSQNQNLIYKYKIILENIPPQYFTPKSNRPLKKREIKSNKTPTKGITYPPSPALKCAAAAKTISKKKPA